MALAPSANLLRLDDCLAAKPTATGHSAIDLGAHSNENSSCCFHSHYRYASLAPLRVYDDMGDAATVNSLHAGASNSAEVEVNQESRTSSSTCACAIVS